MIEKEIRNKIVTQAQLEIVFSRNYKQGKVSNWQKNEDLYYSRKQKVIESRANVDLGRMQEFVNTLLSKIDNPLEFKFTKRKESQLKRVQRLNALVNFDRQRDWWDIKDLVGKKQGVIYGRTIYSYSASSDNGYRPNLENVDVYDYLIDPSAGGIDIEKAMYMGRYGVVKTKADLKKGIEAGDYLKEETEALIAGQSNSNEQTQEEVNKRNRTFDNNVWRSQNDYSQPDKFKFWEWYTTYDGERYYILLQDATGYAIRVEKLTDMFESGLYPFWTWACFPDLTEFWTPSYCDYVREIFMAQSVSINQMLDNAEMINKPMRVIDVGAIENLAELKYRRDGYIKTRSGTDTTKAYQTIQTPSINTPIEVFNILESIQEKASGVTAGAKGVSTEDKVGIYEGNQANTADRFGLLNKSYSFGYHRFAKLYQCGVKEHLTKRIAIQIIGIEGVETEEVNKRDLFYRNEDYDAMVDASNSELQLSEVDKKNKLAFLSANAMNPLVNQKKSFEIEATVAGFTTEEIRELLAKDYGSAEIESEAERDIEYLLDGKTIKPNANANLAYKQKFVDYLKDHAEDIDDDQFKTIEIYLTSVEQIIMENLVKEMQDKQNEMLLQQPQVGGQTGTPDITLPTSTNQVTGQQLL
jgi:hypothetical protein